MGQEDTAGRFYGRDLKVALIFLRIHRSFSTVRRYLKIEMAHLDLPNGGTGGRELVS